MNRILLNTIICVTMAISALLGAVTDVHGAVSYKAFVSNEVVLPFEDAGALSLSPDGGKLSFVRNKFLNAKHDHSEIWMSKTDGNGAYVFLSKDDEPVDFAMPVWSLDGMKIAFVARSGFQIWQITKEFISIYTCYAA